MASVTRLLHRKRVFDDGAIAEFKLWRLPDGQVVRGSSHPFKYSLFYGTAGTRLVGYDNEAGKGDHVHRGEVEAPYVFTSVEQLISDFLSDVALHRGGEL